MKTLLLLVDDTYAEELKEQLPGDKAWILDTRYDAFRCRLHTTLDDYVKESAHFEPYHETIDELNRWLTEKAMV